MGGRAGGVVMRAGLALCVLLAALPAAAQNFPARPVRVIVPYAAGGPTDVVARALTQKIGEAWGQPLVVDNIAGANGVIAQEQAAKALPDGYTIFVQSMAYVVNPLIYKVSYSLERDFVPVSLVASFPLMLAVHPSVPAKSVKELIELAKAKPGQLNYASYGQGSIAQLAAELMKNATGTEITHILYKGAAQGLTDTVAGQVQMTFPSIATGLPFVKQGRLNALAVTSRTRAPQMPNTPTMIEAGIPDYEATSWFGFFYQTGTPKPVIDKLHQEAMRVVRLPDVKTALDAQAFEVVGLGPDKFPDFVRSETRKYAHVVQVAKIKVE
ncbi:MAG: hypothetical protein JWN73_3321 [Betaproteobacteria bacterium]|nr:hypothetical protein [Betaproteobacteria bacterium]